MKKIKVMTVLGTRPEIIRLSRVMARLDEYTTHAVVHTGQNYDYELNEIFFDKMNLRKPDHFLNVNTDSLGSMLGDTLRKSEEVFKKEKPDAVLILGDTNSSIAGIIAKRMKIPIYHMEAGNRCFDFNVPEEINRRIIDHISDFNLVYTEHARRNLLREGIHPRRIYLTGSPLYEVLDYYKALIERSNVLKELGLKRNKYFVASIHREENVDNLSNLKRVLNALNMIAAESGAPVIFSTHPRTRKNMGSLKAFKLNDQIKFMKPFGFFDYVKLQKNSLCVLSDSGTISEEAAMLSFPAVTLRNAMERPEAMDSGQIILTGLDPMVIKESIFVAQREAERKLSVPPSEYTVLNTSERVLKLITGTCKLSHKWDGLESRDIHQDD